MHHCNSLRLVLLPFCCALPSVLCGAQFLLPRGREVWTMNRAGGMGAGGRLPRALRPLTLGAAVRGGTRAEWQVEGSRSHPSVSRGHRAGRKGPEERAQAGLHHPPASLPCSLQPGGLPHSPGPEGPALQAWGGDACVWVGTESGGLHRSGSLGSTPLLTSVLPQCIPFPFTLPSVRWLWTHPGCFVSQMRG